MEKIKLKDYEGEYVCSLNEYDEMIIHGTDEIEKLKALANEGIKIYKVIEKKVFDEHFLKKIKNRFIEYADDNGYEDMSERLDFESEEFKAVEKAIMNFIKSIGCDNNIYYMNKSTIIEVE